MGDKFGSTAPALPITNCPVADDVVGLAGIGGNNAGGGGGGGPATPVVILPPATIAEC